MVRIRFNWRPLFQGRYLLLTNTLSGGVMLSIGDALQQSREIYREPQKVRDWKRTSKTENLDLKHFVTLIDCLVLAVGTTEIQKVKKPNHFFNK